MVKSRFFRRSLILILIISSIPGLIVSGVYYWLAGGRLANEILQLHEDQIMQRAVNLDDQFSYLETSLAHWAFDPKFNLNLKTIDLGREFETTRDIIKTLNVMKGSSPLAKNVELFLNVSQPYLFSREYDVVTDQTVFDSYYQLLGHQKLVFWTKLPEDPHEPAKQDLALVHKIPGTEPYPFGTLIIRLDKEKASALLKTLTPYNVGETFVMQMNGEVLLSSTGIGGANPFEQALKREVAQRGIKAGSFLYKWENNTYTVSFGTFSRIGTDWIYVSASPISVITKPVVFISKLILSVSCASLLLVVILSWLASYKIYTPIDRLVRLLGGDRLFAKSQADHHDEFNLIEKEWLHLTRESAALQNKLEQQLPHVKEGFLLQLVQGFLYSYSEEELLERMRNFGWEVDDRRFLVLHVQLTGFEHLEGRFSQGDEGLVTFAAANIIEELAEGRFEQVNMINFHDLSVGLLIMIPSSQAYKEELEALCGEMMQAIDHILKLQVSITIGRPASSIKDVPSHYEEVREALIYRNFASENQIIDLESLKTEPYANELRYPFALEREILQMIRTGQRQEAQSLVALFLEELLERGAKEIDVQQSMLQLLGSILHTIRHSGMDPVRVFKSSNLYEQLAQIRGSQKMLNWFNHKVIQPFMQELEARADVQIKKAVETALIYLQNNYMNEISLDSCADHVGMNPVVLSRSIKQVTGKNFIDYLTELRMDKAKELLRETDLKMGDVAVSVGYQHSYFNRIFKKQEGITPSEYREMSRRKSHR
ncbi:helix-turn-helix domain-containing protein [Paenibacillus hamazuiensis]|uniref:helix-turn-helix domain-containing protein n=1 Tax=Paenibacillus hamazuiensis TaxID=2936508 RepID=UPI00200E6963|nr:helix-turn-helix domain-containing protein [Paenibacillus hamazuiensis]